MAARKPAPKTTGAATSLSRQPGQPWHHRHGNKPGAPGDRVVDSRRDARVPGGGCGKHRRGQRRNGQGQSESEDDDGWQDGANVAFSATFTTVASRNTMPDPSTVASRIQRAEGSPHLAPSSSAPDARTVPPCGSGDSPPARGEGQSVPVTDSGLLPLDTAPSPAEQ
jgi:hypothetical protein